MNVLTFENFSNLQDRHIVKLIQPSRSDRAYYKKFTALIDDIAHTEEAAAFRHAFKLLVSPAMIDDFGDDHPSRRQWKQSFYPHDLDMYYLIDSNRLRVNNLSAANRLLAMPYYFIEKLDAPIDSISQRAEQHVEYLLASYQQQPLTVKLQFVNATIALMKEFIDYLAAERPRLTL